MIPISGQNFVQYGLDNGAKYGKLETRKKGKMKNKKIMSKELKEELDAFLFNYSTKKDETYKKAVSVLDYAYTMIEKPDFQQMEFDLQNVDKLSNEYQEKLEAYKEADKLDKFFEVLEMFLEAVDKENIPQGQIKEYYQSIWKDGLKMDENQLKEIYPKSYNINEYQNLTIKEY